MGNSRLKGAQQPPLTAEEREGQLLKQIESHINGLVKSGLKEVRPEVEQFYHKDKKNVLYDAVEALDVPPPIKERVHAAVKLQLNSLLKDNAGLKKDSWKQAFDGIIKDVKDAASPDPTVTDPKVTALKVAALESIHGAKMQDELKQIERTLSARSVFALSSQAMLKAEVEQHYLWKCKSDLDKFKQEQEAFISANTELATIGVKGYSTKLADGVYYREKEYSDIDIIVSKGEVRPVLGTFGHGLDVFGKNFDKCWNEVFDFLQVGMQATRVVIDGGNLDEMRKLIAMATKKNLDVEFGPKLMGKISGNKSLLDEFLNLKNKAHDNYNDKQGDLNLQEEKIEKIHKGSIELMKAIDGGDPKKTSAVAVKEAVDFIKVNLAEIKKEILTYDPKKPKSIEERRSEARFGDLAALAEKIKTSDPAAYNDLPKTTGMVKQVEKVDQSKMAGTVKEVKILDQFTAFKNKVRAVQNIHNEVGEIHINQSSASKQVEEIKALFAAHPDQARDNLGVLTTQAQNQKAMNDNLGKLETKIASLPEGDDQIALSKSIKDVKAQVTTINAELTSIVTDQVAVVLERQREIISVIDARSIDAHSEDGEAMKKRQEGVNAEKESLGNTVTAMPDGPDKDALKAKMEKLNELKPDPDWDLVDSPRPR